MNPRGIKTLGVKFVFNLKFQWLGEILTKIKNSLVCGPGTEGSIDENTRGRKSWWTVPFNESINNTVYSSFEPT